MESNIVDNIVEAIEESPASLGNQSQEQKEEEHQMITTEVIRKNSSDT